MSILDRTFAAYVNLDHRPGRRDRMEYALRAAGIKASRRRGMLPEEYGGVPARIKAMAARPQRGAIGCHFSQVAIMETALCKGLHALVMEDDLVFCSDFQKRLRLIENFTLEVPWDIIWLGATFHVNPPHWHVGNSRGCKPLGRDAKRTIREHPRFIRTFGCFCTYAYLVNVMSIPKIMGRMEEMLPESIGIDHMMIMLQPGLLTYSFLPGCVKQYDHTSDIGVSPAGGPGFTKFSAFSRLNGTAENSRYWWQDLMEDFDPEGFDWHEAGFE